MINENAKPSLQDKVHIWLPLMLAMVLVGGILIGQKIHLTSRTNANQSSLRFSQPGGSIEELIRYVEAKYVDDIDSKKLTQEAIQHMLAELDPHSSYISVEDLKGVQEQLKGNFDGIGIEFMFLDDTIVVVAPLAGGPSEAVGIEAGDKIITVEDSIVAGMSLGSDDIVSLLRGEKGTEVNVGVLRAGQKDLLSFTITRDKIPMHSLDIAQMLDDDTGYIKINRFSATTFQEFKDGVDELIFEGGMKDLVLDLRHNPGGYLQQATKMLDLLFDEGEQLLVYTEGRAAKRKEYRTSGLSQFEVDNVIVLINEGSASASEIMAGAIQDLDRGIIIGRRSFGKGLVQEQYPLRDGSALRLTVARYYTPSGRCIQREYGDDAGDYNGDLADRYNSGELSDEEKVEAADSTKFYTKNGHVVFGGGGVTPDVFVPIDTTLLNTELAIWRQYIPGFVFRFAEGEDNPFAEMNEETFASNYQTPTAVYDDFLNYGFLQNENLEAPTLTRVKQELQFLLKARLGRKYFGDDCFFKVINSEDDMILEALKVLNQPDPLAAARN